MKFNRALESEGESGSSRTEQNRTTLASGYINSLVLGSPLKFPALSACPMVATLGPCGQCEWHTRSLAHAMNGQYLRNELFVRDGGLA